MNSFTTQLSNALRHTQVSLGGLTIGVLGLVIQWIADTSKFPGLPPGIIFIAVCAALVVALGRRWWSPVFAVLIAAWIVIGGLLSGELANSLSSQNLGTVSGNIVMCVGLAIAGVAGALAMNEGRRLRTSRVTDRSLE